VCFLKTLRVFIEQLNIDNFKEKNLPQDMSARTHPRSPAATTTTSAMNMVPMGITDRHFPYYNHYQQPTTALPFPSYNHYQQPTTALPFPSYHHYQQPTTASPFSSYQCHTDSQYPISDYGRYHGMTNGYANYNPYHYEDTQWKFNIPGTGAAIDTDKFPEYAFWTGQKLVAGAAAGLGVRAYNWTGDKLGVNPNVPARGPDDSRDR